MSEHSDIYASSYLASQPLLRNLVSAPKEAPIRPLSPALLNLLTELRGNKAFMESLEGVTQKQLGYEVDKVLRSQVMESLARGVGEREVTRPTCIRLPNAGAISCPMPSSRTIPPSHRVRHDPEIETGSQYLHQRRPLPSLCGPQ